MDEISRSSGSLCLKRGYLQEPSPNGQPNDLKSETKRSQTKIAKQTKKAQGTLAIVQAPRKSMACSRMQVGWHLFAQVFVLRRKALADFPTSQMLHDDERLAQRGPL